MAGGGYDLYPTTLVWWDINTCPVPEGYEPGRVRQSIESALSNYMGPRPVIIFCVGNLEYISLQVLREISSSGIRLRHAPFGGTQVFELVCEWRETKPSTILLISGDGSWFNDSIHYYGAGARIRAFPGRQPPVRTSPAKEWVWKYLLEEEGRGPPVEIESRLLEYAPEFFCRVCFEPGLSFDEFISHLRSTEHKQELMDSVIRVDDNGNPVNICKLCDYAYYDDNNKNLHLQSEEHKNKVLKQNATSDDEEEMQDFDDEEETQDSDPPPTPLMTPTGKRRDRPVRPSAKAKEMVWQSAAAGRGKRGLRKWRKSVN